MAAPYSKFYGTLLRCFQRYLHPNGAYYLARLCSTSASSSTPDGSTVSPFNNVAVKRRIPGSESEQKQFELDDRPKFTVEEDADFTWVEKIIRPETHPSVPHHSQYPTPSGWVPQTAKFGDYAYHVRRTASHHVPVYLRETYNKRRKTTQIRYIDGDIWALELALRKHLRHIHKADISTEVNEVTRVIKINGVYTEDVSQFLIDRGF